jgi:hypothetical protein
LEFSNIFFGGSGGLTKGFGVGTRPIFAAMVVEKQSEGMLSNNSVVAGNCITNGDAKYKSESPLKDLYESAPKVSICSLISTKEASPFFGQIFMVEGHCGLTCFMFHQNL